jgi:hypothetical protein
MVPAPPESHNETARTEIFSAALTSIVDGWNSISGNAIVIGELSRSLQRLLNGIDLCSRDESSFLSSEHIYFFNDLIASLISDISACLASLSSCT